MKILLATDGSESAKSAEALVASARWPGGSRITALQVDQLLETDLELPAPAYTALRADLRNDAERHLAEVKKTLVGEGREVDTDVILGRPGSVIIAEAARRGVDLVVTGSHGRGAIGSAFLGSVAAEVVDHAGCPVLVARRPALSGIVLGTDGSEGALHAEKTVARWSVLADLPVTVVSVVDMQPLYGLMYDSYTGVSPLAYEETFEALRAAARALAEESVRRLRSMGVTAKADAREGFVGAEIVQGAKAAGADLIVVGSRGRTGVARLLLGSVARNVLHHSPTSVLIVREQLPAPGA